MRRRTLFIDVRPNMSVPSSVDDWTDEYESILEFYFWEPQHLNRRAHTSGKNPGVDVVLDRLRTKEVPLNHLLGLFFRLVPPTLAARVLASMSQTAVGDMAKHVNTATFRRSQIYGICQPDFLFETGDGLVF